ncbi:unnamed protein product [Brachionus calyciflorus]|uniref:BED-type domain-containing protein n=1 Tax=Brachionus calyciflorus TaxID=104777 RepID=A0A813V446_9BILA|nr:unnamed protein product [Brachionus calyciflorus]
MSSESEVTEIEQNSKQTKALNSTGKSTKKRRNESFVNKFFSKTSYGNQCLVENCTKTYSFKTGHSTLAYHLNSEHKIEESSEDEETRTTIKSPKISRNHRETSV